MVGSALSEPLSLLLVSGALCDFPRLLSALLGQDLLTLLHLDMSDAVHSEVLVLLAWALSVSLSLDGLVLAELLVFSLHDLSVPLLGLLAGAWPEVDVDLVLVLSILSGEASVGLLVLDLLTLDGNLLGEVLLVVLSHNEGSTSLDSLTGLGGDGKMRLNEKSDGVGSLVHDEP